MERAQLDKFSRLLAFFQLDSWAHNCLHSQLYGQADCAYGRSGCMCLLNSSFFFGSMKASTFGGTSHNPSSWEAPRKKMPPVYRKLYRQLYSPRRGGLWPRFVAADAADPPDGHLDCTRLLPGFCAIWRLTLPHQIYCFWADVRKRGPMSVNFAMFVL